MSISMVNWKTWAPIIIAIFATISPITLYQIWYKQPDITYQILESYPYSAEDSVTCIILRNVGHATAHDVLLVIESSHPFTKLIIEAPELYENKNVWENQTEAKIWFQRITEGAEITTYASAKTLSPEIEVSITSEEGAGRQHKEPSRLSLAVFMLIEGILIGILILLLVAAKYPKTFARFFGIKKEKKKRRRKRTR